MIIKNFKISAIAAAVIAGSAMLPSTALFAQEMVEEIITPVSYTHLTLPTIHSV